MEWEEEKIKKRYKQIQKDLEKAIDLTEYCKKCGDQAQCLPGVECKECNPEKARKDNTANGQILIHQKM